MNSKEIIKEIKGLDIRDSKNLNKISSLLNKLRDIEGVKRYKKDLKMMKKIKMEFVGL